MRICMILEGCYPYVRGGVSSWMHALITSMPQHEYVLWVIGAKSEDRGKFKYELPKNVVEIREVFLDDALSLRSAGPQHVYFSKQEINELRKMIVCEEPDWNILFRLYNKKKVSAVSFLMSEEFLNILLDVCQNNYPYVSFAEFFHAIRSMLLPSLYLLGQDVPQADVYHATSTGYGGLLGALGAWRNNRPFVLTEHGIYTREREEEILRSKWVSSSFKQHWINMFFMLAHCSYSRAVRVTSLFQRYSDVQVTLGCDPGKRKVIGNGIRVKNFSSIPLKKPNGFIDIAAIIRIHPIKDIKTMIHAFFELKARVPNARLHIWGDTDDEEYREECVDLINQLQLQDLTLEGNVNVLEELRKIDFTVLTSISEGQPLAVLESLAASRPCVTTDVGCCRELLEGGVGDTLGRAGFCEPPMYSQAIAGAMEQLATREDLRLSMGTIGRTRVLSHYVHEDMVHNYDENYKEVLGLWQGSASN